MGSCCCGCCRMQLWHVMGVSSMSRLGGLCCGIVPMGCGSWCLLAAQAGTVEVQDQKSRRENISCRAGGEDSSGRVTVSLMLLMACLSVCAAPRSHGSTLPKTKMTATTLLVCEPGHVAGISLFFLLPITLFVPGSGSGSAKLSLYPSVCSLAESHCDTYGKLSSKHHSSQPYVLWVC